MPACKLTVLVDVDDVPIAGFPLTQRLELTEAQTFEAIRAVGSGFVTLSTAAEVGTRDVIIITGDQPVQYRFNGGAENFDFGPNGVVVFFGVTQTGETSVSNLGTAPATIRAVIAGA